MDIYLIWSILIYYSITISILRVLLRFSHFPFFFFIVIIIILANEKSANNSLIHIMMKQYMIKIHFNTYVTHMIITNLPNMKYIAKLSILRI